MLFKNLSAIYILCYLNSITYQLDPMPASVLKKCSSSVISAMTSIINSSLQSSTGLLEFKKAVISLLLKMQNFDVNIFS